MNEQRLKAFHNRTWGTAPRRDYSEERNPFAMKRFVTDFNTPTYKSSSSYIYFVTTGTDN